MLLGNFSVQVEFYNQTISENKTRMQPSKTITIITFLLFSFLTNAQTYQLNARVSIHNSRVDNGPMEYVEDAKVSNELSPTRITDYKGRVELNFIDVDPSSIINLKVEKAGYEVVNKDALKNIQISENPSIRIFLTEKGKLEEMEKGLFKYSLRNISARKDSLFYLLNLRAVSEDNIVEELEKKVGQKISDEMEAKLLLNQFAKDLEKELPDLIHQVVVVNLDFASDRYKKAHEHFTKNQLDQALKTLDEKKLDTLFENVLVSIEQASETPELYQKIINVRSVQIDNIIESFELRKILLKLTFRFAEAEDLSLKIAQMKTLIENNQKDGILKDQQEPEDIIEGHQAVNILLDDTLHLALIDTNWVELELDKLISTKGDVEEEMSGNPKAKTILETLSNNTGDRVLGIDFENALLVKKNRKLSEIPIYEQPTPVLVSNERVVNTSPSMIDEKENKTESETEWLEFYDLDEPESTINSKPVLELEKETNVSYSPSERIVFTDIIEPSYETYRITKKTSFRQRATAASKVLKRLQVGTEVKVIEQVDRYWFKAILNGKVGYVKVLLSEKVN